MLLRTITPLNDRHWKALVEDLQNGQTDEQAEFMNKAIKRIRNLNMSVGTNG